MVDSDYIAAHEHSIRHRDDILRSDICGCFYCLKTFAPAQVIDWINEPIDTGATALCPFCGIDSVIGSASGYPIERKFLAFMEEHWFVVIDTEAKET